MPNKNLKFGKKTELNPMMESLLWRPQEENCRKKHFQEHTAHLNCKICKHKHLVCHKNKNTRFKETGKYFGLVSSYQNVAEKLLVQHGSHFFETCLDIQCLKDEFHPPANGKIPSTCLCSTRDNSAARRLAEQVFLTC